MTVMSSTWVPQAEHAQALAELAAAREALYCAVQQRTVLADALRLISRHGCESFTGGRSTCRNSGRTRGARCIADAWCDSCVAVDALETLTVTGP